MGYRKKANMYKSEKLQMDNLVYVCISVTVTLDGSQDLFFQSFYKELKLPGRLERELLWDWVQHDAFPIKET